MSRERRPKMTSLPSLKEVFINLNNRPASCTTRNALMWGVAWIIVSTIGGWHFHLAPTSALGYDLYGYMPLLWHLVINFVQAIVFTLPFIVVVLILNHKASISETFSRVLFAHWPATLLLLPAIFVSGNQYALLTNNLRVAFESDATAATLFALLLVVVVVWIVRWVYVAFRKVTPRMGYVTLMLFGVALVVATVATDWVLHVIYGVINSL